MEHEVRGFGFDGRLGSLVLERMAFRSKLEKDAAYLYIPVDDNEEVQQAQYDVLDALNADLVTLEPQSSFQAEVLQPAYLAGIQLHAAGHQVTGPRRAFQNPDL